MVANKTVVEHACNINLFHFDSALLYHNDSKILLHDTLCINEMYITLFHA